MSTLAYILEEHALPNADIVIAANELMAAYCKKKTSSEVYVIPNYPLRSFKPRYSNRTWRKMHNIPLDKKIVLFLASTRLEEIYGFNMIIEAWRYVVEEYPNAMLLIIGPVKKRKNLPKNIKILGSRPYSEIPDWINIANVCIAPRTKGFPSNFYNDKDSNKISEYAALGKPIVACGYSESKQYFLTKCTSESFAKGIIHALNGKVVPAKPKFWEDENEKNIFEIFDRFFK
ncbi:MAG: glycosyltransferase family 4 protein [Candidatus Asgardarchaeia archaeon]